MKYRWFRFHIGNRYIWMEDHPYFGPCFWISCGGRQIPYDPEEADIIWDEYKIWKARYV